jgi:hypothetical protein
VYALQIDAAISGKRGGAPVTEDEYEDGASGAATAAILKGGAKGAVIGALGGPVGAALGFLVGAMVFGEPEVLERDRKYNEEQARRRR